MHTRLIEIIKYKTKGKQTEFASLLGWSPQYLAKLIKGENFGISPVITILTKFSEINARWFLLGDGEMINDTKFSETRKIMHQSMIKILDIEKYMHVMSPEELRDFESIAKGRKEFDFSPNTVEKWDKQLKAHEDSLNKKTGTICKQKIAKK